MWAPTGARDGRVPLTIQAMRRRIRSAAFPLHRHFLPQLVVDGALVALAYYLAFELRFNNGPNVYYSHLRERTILWVALGPPPRRVHGGGCHPPAGPF